MEPTRADHVPPAIRIDVETEWAWCGDRRLDLPARVFALLRHLVEHPRRLITKNELFAALWGDTVVSEAALTSCVRDLRKALGDPSHAPRYIETVHGRGFRFIGPVVTGPAVAPGGRPETRPPAATTIPPPSAPFVGRAAELARLRAFFATAARGQRRLVFVTGEPGIGKTALVEAFLAELRDVEGLCIGRGQCVEQYGVGEAYLPVLEALGRLGREAHGRAIVRVLKQYAPTWLAQLPALLTDEELEAVQRRAHGTSRDRMLRELVEAVDALSRDAPLVLVLEDLHWSDSATIDLLGMLARRPEVARLLVLATYRPADVAGGPHPLRSVKQALQLHGHCEELALEFLSAAAIGEYLSRRFPQHGFPPDLATVLHRSTDGNALFVVNTVDYLIGRAQMRELDGQWKLSTSVEEVARQIPGTLADMVETHLERLTPDEQALLAVASVAGVEFSAAVAPAGAMGTREAERLCEGLRLRTQFLRGTGLVEWPDGTLAEGYAFVHALYRNVLYARMPVGHRVGLHLRTGELLERSYGGQSGEIASELAMHFEHGRDLERAVRYRRQAGEQALRRHGYREAAEHATRGLELLQPQPDSPERAQQELSLHMMLGSALTALKGHAAPEVEQAYARARALAEQVHDPGRLFPVLLALGWFYLMRGPSDAALDVGRRLATMAEATGDRAVLLAAHNVLGLASFYRGEFEAALDHAERGIALYDPTAHSPAQSPAFRANVDPGASSRGHAAWALWVLGYPERAAARMREGLALARSIAHPFSLTHSHRFGAAFHLSRRERHAVQEHADASFALSAEHGFDAAMKAANFHRGWVLAEQDGGDAGLAPMREWLTVCRDIRAAMLMPTYLAWLAEVLGNVGRPAEGLSLLHDAFTAEADSGYRYWAAELHRLKGTLTLQAGREGVSGTAGRHRATSARRAARATVPGTLAEQRAESCFLEALDIARRQRARLFELRAATSLSRLWARQGKASEAHALLSDVYAFFVEGFDTADLAEARALLTELERGVATSAPVRSRRSSRRPPASPRRHGKA